MTINFIIHRFFGLLCSLTILLWTIFPQFGWCYSEISTHIGWLTTTKRETTIYQNGHTHIHEQWTYKFLSKFNMRNVEELCYDNCLMPMSQFQFGLLIISVFVFIYNLAMVVWRSDNK